MRSFAYGNGTTLIMLDNYGRLRDCYFPYVGLENHIGGGLQHRIGVWVDDTFSWTDDNSWEIVCASDAANTGHIAMYSARLGLELQFTDVLYNGKEIFVRRIAVLNKSDRQRVVRLFFNSQFEIAATARGDTAYYDPQASAVIHYEGSRAFLVSGTVDEKGPSDWTVGIFQIEGKEGTYRDAEDGVLSKNPIEHGRVDSTFALESSIEPHSTKIYTQWLCMAESIEGVIDMHHDVIQRTPEYISLSAKNYWHAWVSRSKWDYYALPTSVIDLFIKSQFLIRSHADKNGGVIASGDTDMLQGGRDTYCYIWPRDGSYIASAFSLVGDFPASRRFFEFCAKAVTEDGYLMHKYRPDGSLGSSWHGWLVNNHRELPIQEDETALVLWSLWEYWKDTRDLEFIENIYDNFIKKAAYFLTAHRDPYTGLPRPSYDLWEERFGVHTYTVAATYAGLWAAAQFATMLGKDRSASDFLHIANDIRPALMKHLYNEETGLFYRSLTVDEAGVIHKDETVDASSAYGVFMFKVLEADDERLVKAMKKAEELLTVQTPTGGIARYAGDKYYKKVNSPHSNSWVITTLWWAQYAIARAATDDDLDPVRKTLERVARLAGPTGILPEQIDPQTGGPVSASPLVWSHAEYVRTVVQYLQKCRALGIIDETNY